MKPLALSLLALFVLSIVTIPLSSYALTPATFTDQPTFTSLNSDRWSKVWTDDRNQAIVLDGSTDYLTASVNTIYDQTTNDFWTVGIFETDADNTTQMLFRKKSGAAAGYTGYIANNNRLSFQFADASTHIDSSSSSLPIETNTRYLFGYSFNHGSQVTMFLHNLDAGSFVGSASFDISTVVGSVTTTQTYTIGRNSGAASAFCACTFDQWIPPQTGILSQANFLQLATGNWSAVPFSNLYDFNAGNTNDIIGNNHLTMNGAPTFTSDVADISPITGTYFLDVQENGAALDFKSVLVSPWGSIHKTNTVSHSVAQTIRENSPNMSDVQIDSSTGVKSVYMAGIDTQSTPVVYAAHVNIDTGAVISSGSQNTTNVATGGRIDVSAANRVYVDYRATGAVNQVHSVSFATGLTGGAHHVTTGITTNTGDVITTLKTFGATQAQDVRYVLTTSSASNTSISRITANATGANLGTITGNSATAMSLTDTSSLVIGQATSGGTVRTFTIDKSTDTVSSVLFTETWTTIQTQVANRFTDGTKTYHADGLAYYATPAKAVSYGASNSVLSDPAIRYIEDATSSTLTGVGGIFYRLSDSLIVTGPGTTWTPKTIAGVHITPTPFSEPIAAPPVSNSTVFNDNVIRLACDANYLLGSHVVVGDDSDCTTWIVLPTSAADVGRQLPYSRTTELIHANPLTAYTVNVFTNEPIDLGINVLYHNKLVDTNVFGDDDNAQIRLLYGNCYTTQYVQLDTDEIVHTGQFCAADQSTIQAIIRADLGFTFWNVHWGVVHDWDFDTKVVDLIVRHKSFPYTYDVKIFNATGTAIVDVTQNSANEIHITDYNLSAFAAQGPFRLDVYRGDNGNRIYSQHLTDGGLASQFTSFFDPLGDIEFAGWGIMMFLPIIFAAMFTRSTAGIGGGMLVAFIGVLVFMGIIAMEEGAIWLITFVAVVGLLAYRVIRQ